MAELSVAILAADEEQRTVLQMLVDNTTIARTAYTSGAFPVGGTDVTLRRIQDMKPEVLIIEVAGADPGPALRAIELLHEKVPGCAVFALGDTSQPQVIVTAMRSGAREFLERPPNTNHLLEAFVRLSASKRRKNSSGSRGKVFTVVNAKGGAGASTIAVNTAVSLQNMSGSAALVDLAPIGHAALYLNVKPSFTILDAMRNLHRLDASVVGSLMTRASNGLHLLAGATEPYSIDVANSDLARLFDMLVGMYERVVVDASGRLDPAVRMVSELSDTVLLVAQTDVASLWSAARVQRYLTENGNRERLRLVLNRFRKIPGFSEGETETITGAKLIWKIPSQYAVLAASLDRGVPVTAQNHSELARSFVGLAAALTQSGQSERRTPSLLFKSA